jgi:CHAT domain-containing protein/Tfp pilus assembly protein PilF
MNKNPRLLLLFRLVFLLASMGALSIIAAQPPAAKGGKQALADKVFNEASDLYDRETAESYRAALEKFNEAALLFHEANNKEGQAASLSMAGSTSENLGDTAGALRFYEQALPLILALGDRLEEALVLNKIGFGYHALGENVKALKYLSQGLPALRAMADTPGEALALSNIGSVYLDLGEKAKALEYYNQALSLTKTIGDKNGEALALNHIGVTYSGLGERTKALEYFNQALLLRKTVRNKAAEAATMSSIGLVYSDLGEKSKALEYYDQALPLLREVGNKAVESATLGRIGAVYLDLGETAKALEYFNRDLSLTKESGNKNGEGMVLGNIGVLYSSLGENQKALEYLNRALLVLKAVGNNAAVAATLANIGAVYADLGEKSKALEYYDQALPMQKAAGDKADEAVTLTNIGGIYFLLDEKAKALEYFSRALRILRAVGARAGEAVIYRSLMVYWDHLKNPKLAVFYGKQGVNLYQALRLSVKDLDKNVRQTYLRSVETSYRFLADLLISQGRIAEAEEVLAMLKEDEVFSYLRRDDKVAKDLLKTVSLTEDERRALTRYNELADLITKIGKEFGELETERKKHEANRFPKQARIDDLKTQLADATVTFQKFLDELTITFGKTDARVATVDSGLKAMLQRLKAPRTVVVSTILGEKRLNIIVTTANTQRAHTIDKSEEEILRIIMEFRQALTDPSIDPRPSSQKLYDILVKPIEKDLEGVNADTIVWSLDGALRYIPASALWDKEKGYLVERFSGAVITLAGSRTVELPPGNRQKTGALGVGVSNPVEGFSALPAVPDELDCIITDIQGKTVSSAPVCQSGVITGRKLLNEKFTLSAFEDAVGRYPVIHIASHFRLNPGSEQDSFLLLGGGEQKRYTIGNLRGAPLAEVDLIVLSACNTATPGGKKTNGVEIEGFGVVAQQQGAKAVMATLWSVADNSTRDLMVRFYELYGKSGLSKAEALRQAQLSMISGSYKPGDPNARRDSKKIDLSIGGNVPPPFKKDDNAPYAHPYFWSPFVLMGNWR